MSPKVPDALTAAARLAGRRRAAALEQPLARAAPRNSGESPSTIAAAPLVLGDDDGRPVFRLAGQIVRTADVLELYTNRANGWLRGRFEWSGDPAIRPHLEINLWDPIGPRDEDGLPPWVATLAAPLPVPARLRWPSRS
jgi:hypothetical protein